MRTNGGGLGRDDLGNVRQNTIDQFLRITEAPGGDLGDQVGAGHCRMPIDPVNRERQFAVVR